MSRAPRAGQLAETRLRALAFCTCSSTSSMCCSASNAMSAASVRWTSVVCSRAVVPSHVDVLGPGRRAERRGVDRGRGRRQRDGLHGARPRDQLARAAGGDDAAAIDDRDAIAERLGFLDVVRRQQHRVAVLLHSGDLAVQLAAGLRIEAGRRLVEEDELGLVDERERQGEPLALAARQRVERRRRPCPRARSARAAPPGSA